MKVKTITCHDVYNYGASLQTFALQTFLEKNGHDVEVIDYKPFYINFPYKISLFVPPNSLVKKYTDKSVVIRFLYAFKRYLWYIPSLQRKRAFDRFTKKYLKLTRRYENNNDLAGDVPEADIYVVGSDQVWNSVTMINGLDPAFYLQFAPAMKTRISYAASFGGTSISVERKLEIQKWLKALSAVSVRESSGLDVLRDLQISGTHVCDPVFLLSEDEWRTMFRIDKLSEPYVLIYNLTAVNQQLIEDAIFTANQLGLKIYSVSPIKIHYVDKNYTNVGPEDFVKLIFNSQFIFTNSFHATAFSIISHRQFCTYNYHSQSNSSRMYSVLEEMHMLDRLNICDIKNVIANPISYKDRDDLIQKSCSKGKTWLLNNM